MRLTIFDGERYGVRLAVATFRSVAPAMGDLALRDTADAYERTFRTIPARIAEVTRSGWQPGSGAGRQPGCGHSFMGEVSEGSAQPEDSRAAGAAGAVVAGVEEPSTDA